MQKSEEAEDTKYNAEDLAIRDDDRIHVVVFRLQAYVSVFFIESLYRSRIIHQGSDHITVGSRILLLDNDHITITDTGIDHAFALDTEHKGILIWHVFCRDREIILNILNG